MNTHPLDQPTHNPKRRRPFEQLLAELAERTGRPLWTATPWEGGRNITNRSLPDFQPRYTSAAK